MNINRQKASRLSVVLFAAVLASRLAPCRAGTLYVDLNSANPIPPFTNWNSAATNIQDAVDASVDGDLILVTNGIYSTGGRNWFGSGTNRVTLTNNITLRSVNGPGVTWIVGNRVPGTGLALTNAARCVYMTQNAIVSGFTLTNGEAGFGNYPSGGGVVGGTVTNCLLTGNLATNSAGGGAYRSALIDCQVRENSASSGGGACACGLTGCTVVSNRAVYGGGIYGGGSYGASGLTNCVVAANSASAFGGGAYGGTFIGCSVSNNTATGGGGGGYLSAMIGCRISGNQAGNGGGISSGQLLNCLVTSNRAGSGGGISEGTISNCTVLFNFATNSGGGVSGSAWCYNSIFYYNSAPNGSNVYGVKVDHCCTQPRNMTYNDETTVTNEPMLVDLASGDYHLQATSPCINAGNNAFVTGPSDLDGLARIAGGTVDIGCYEYPAPASVISYAWLQRNGLPVDGSADFADSDNDGASTWAEWLADTSPTNPLSFLAMKAIVPAGGGAGVSVTWQSVSTRTYYVQRSGNLSLPGSFGSVKSNIFGRSGTITFLDQTATNSGPYFYRVGIQ